MGRSSFGKWPGKFVTWVALCQWYRWQHSRTVAVYLVLLADHVWKQ